MFCADWPIACAGLLASDGSAPANLPDGVIDLPLDSPLLGDFGPAVGEILSLEGVEAALVRPDRYVFGSGDAQDLVRAWAGTLAAEEA